MVSRQPGRLGQVQLVPPAHILRDQQIFPLPCLPHQWHNLILDSDSRLETDTNMVMRFVIGQTSDQAQEADLVAEINQYGGFMRLHLQVYFLAPLYFWLQLLKPVHTSASPLVHTHFRTWFCWCWCCCCCCCCCCWWSLALCKTGH